MSGKKNGDPLILGFSERRAASVRAACLIQCQAINTAAGMQVEFSGTITALASEHLLDSLT